MDQDRFLAFFAAYDVGKPPDTFSCTQCTEVLPLLLLILRHTTIVAKKLLNTSTFCKIWTLEQHKTMRLITKDVQSAPAMKRSIKIFSQKLFITFTFCKKLTVKLKWNNAIDVDCNFAKEGVCNNEDEHQKQWNEAEKATEEVLMIKNIAKGTTNPGVDCFDQ